MDDFKILNKETVYAGRAFGVQRVSLRLPNNRETIYDLVAHNDSVSIVPIDQDGNVWFVRQFRLGAGSQLLELPAGVLEKDEDPAICAARELREEISMGSKELKCLGDFYLTPGYCDEPMYVYLATGLYPESLPQDADEFLDVVKIPLPKAFEMARNGEIKDSKSLAALLLAQPYISIP